jgi:hypothetical protein
VFSRVCACALLLIALQSVTPALSQEEARADAWWTGPLLANSAETGVPGHVLIEPYFFDVISGHTNSFGSRTYMLAGLADNLSGGLIAVAGYNKTPGEPSGPGMGDLGATLQYRLTEFQDGDWFPTTSLQVQETFPTGRYDNLGEHPGDGIGAGAYATTLEFNSQTYLWLANGRILRVRLDAADTISGSASLNGASVYGTGSLFHGSAQPGNSSFVDLAFEYSMTQNWVLALDTVYNYASNTRVRGYDTTTTIRTDTGSSDSVAFAPAIEYNFTANLGVIAGARIVDIGHKTSHSIAPVMAINFVH